MPNAPSFPTVMIGLGNKQELALDQYNNLIVMQNRQIKINLGPLTQQRAKEIGSYLDRLAIHTSEN